MLDGRPHQPAHAGRSPVLDHTMNHPRIVLAVVLSAGVLHADEPLQAGFASADATPKLGDKPVFVAGFGHNRLATGVADPITVRAVVLKHGETKIALAAADIV